MERRSPARKRSRERSVSRARNPRHRPNAGHGKRFNADLGAPCDLRCGEPLAVDDSGDLYSEPPAGFAAIEDGHGQLYTKAVARGAPGS